MQNKIILLLKDHSSLKYRGVWEYFRAGQTDNKLYMLVNRVLNEKGILIGYEAEEAENR